MTAWPEKSIIRKHRQTHTHTHTHTHTYTHTHTHTHRHTDTHTMNSNMHDTDQYHRVCMTLIGIIEYAWHWSVSYIIHACARTHIRTHARTHTHTHTHTDKLTDYDCSWNLKPGVGQNIATHASPTARNILHVLISTTPVHSPSLFHNSLLPFSPFTVCRVGPLIKTGHLAHMVKAI